MSPELNKTIERYLEGDDADAIQPFLDAIIHADYETFDKIEDMIIGYVRVKGDSAGAKVLPIAALMSSKFHSFGMKNERDIWKKAIGTHFKEVDDVLSTLYDLDDGGEE